MLLIPALLFLGGCDSAREINDMAIVSGAAFDWDAEQETYRVTAEVVNREAEPGSQASPLVIDGEGKTPEEAMANLDFKTSRKILWSHARVLILSKETAKAGIAPFVEMVMADNSLRLSTELLIADMDSAEKVWEITTDATEMIGFDLDDMIHEARESGGVPSLRAYHAKMLLETAGQPVIPMIGMDERENAVITGAAILQGDKMVGSLSREESEALCR